jgi:hypothetical protein
VRAIGVSNFMPEHLEELLRNTAVVPLFDFELAGSELAAIDSLDRSAPRGPEPTAIPS